MAGLFWEDLAADLEDPAFLREYVRESIRIATVDALMNALDDARLAEGLSKVELARAIGADPAAVRRLFAAGNANPNPTLGTLVDVAAALGMRITLEPLPAGEREMVTEPLRTGRVARSVIDKLSALRRSTRRQSAQPA
ncbi:helix-turn-helix transcriptional regulator [Actinoallomurus purpureus]|uniref:helix-turn-helix domain-containing protein n=1 Tax=Actinoallomurus purpureus TaxID=478114 RepID=UPI0020939230|nr:helix-turn-helix transcriptional regulator [Actinoallomurus purpureus]MCO6003403.1 helix-turn-helix transcriptional regulator [Actinoallomurus purpureus]